MKFEQLIEAASNKSPTEFLEVFNEGMAEYMHIVLSARKATLFESKTDGSVNQFLTENNSSEPLDIGSFVNEMADDFSTDSMGERSFNIGKYLSDHNPSKATTPKPFKSDAIGKQEEVGEADPKKSIKPKTIKALRNAVQSIKPHKSNAIGTPGTNKDDMPVDEFVAPGIN